MSSEVRHHDGSDRVTSEEVEYEHESDEHIFGDDDEKARRLSDHRPVWAEFSTDTDDDPKKPDGAAGDSGK